MRMMLLSLCLVSCSLNLTATRRGGAPCDSVEAERTIFRDTVHATAKPKCSACHSIGSIPQFVNSDLVIAFQVATPLMTGNPSHMEIHSGNGHCGTDCSDSTLMKVILKAFHEGVSKIPSCSSNQSSPTPEATPTATISSSPMGSPIAGASAGKVLYDQRCSGCHVLGAYDPNGGAPDLKGHANDVNGEFSNGMHQGATLTNAEIVDIKTFIASIGQ